MTVFLTYSREDRAFVDRLSIERLNHNVKVWRDEYKLSAGDSLTQRIQSGIEQASFLCVVISDSALASDWVKRSPRAVPSHRSRQQVRRSVCDQSAD
jgi:hypothetical protein